MRVVYRCCLGTCTWSCFPSHAGSQIYATIVTSIGQTLESGRALLRLEIVLEDVNKVLAETNSTALVKSRR